MIHRIKTNFSKWLVPSFFRTDYEIDEGRQRKISRNLAALFIASIFIFSFINTIRVDAAISEKQSSVSGNCSGNPSCSASATLGSTATSGNLLVVVCGVGSQSGTPSATVTGFTSAVGSMTTNGSASGSEVFWKESDGTEASITCLGAAGGNMRGFITIFEYEGMDTTTPVDVTSTNTGSSSSPTTGNAVTTVADTLLIAGITMGNGTGFGDTWNSSFTEESDHTNSGNRRQGTASRVVSSTGTYNTGSSTGNTTWSAQLVAFEGAGGAPAAGVGVYEQLTQKAYIWENDDGNDGGGGGGGGPLVIETKADTVTGGSGGDVTITKPSGTEEDDLLVAFLSVRGNTATWATLSGWTELHDLPHGTEQMAVAVQYKVAGASEGSDYTFVASTTNDGRGGQILRISGADTTTPIDDSAEANDTTFNSTMDVPSVTTTVADTLILVQYANDSGAADPFTPPSGMTEEFDSSDWGTQNHTMGVASELLTATETTGVQSATPSASDRNTGLTVAVAQASGGGPVGAADNSQLAAGDTAITDVRAGAKINLRTHLDNGGDVADSNLALFYDRNDGLWSKVESQAPPSTASGSGCDDTNWTCTALDTTDTVGSHSSIAINPVSGLPAIAYNEETGSELNIAWYVGSGGSCADTAWQCDVIESTNDPGNFIDLAFDSTGKAWVASLEEGSDDIVVAEYVGTGGSGCDSSAWTCVTVAATNVLDYPSMAIDPDDGAPSIVFQDDNGNDLVIAEYVSSGGDCDSTYGGSDAWECSVIESTDTVDGFTDIAFDAGGNAIISYEAGSSDLYMAEYVGGTSGSGCNDAAYTCTAVWVTGNIQQSAIGIAPDDTVWIAHLDDGDDLNVAVENGGAGGDCDSAQAGSDLWNCVEIDTSNADGDWLDAAFAPDGTMAISYYDTAGGDLRYARYVASSGSGCTSSAWTCVDVETTDTAGEYNSLVFDDIGRAWISYSEDSGGDLELAMVDRRGDILIEAAFGFDSGDDADESRTDMTTTTDTTNRDDADCETGGANWNDGVLISDEELAFDLADGSSTVQCTELSWSLDTTNAVGGATYRFVVATDDGWDISKSPWRGPVTVSQYATMTMANNDEVRYAKGLQSIWTSCDDTDWGCLVVDDDSTDNVGDASSMALDNDGQPWIAYSNVTDDSLYVGKYVGTGGGGCEDSSWDCDLIETTGSSGVTALSLAFDPAGNPWVSYHDDASDLAIARYVGSGGTGCTVGAAWDCVTVESGTTFGVNNEIAFAPDGTAYIVFDDVTGDDLELARYVGGTNGSGCTSSDWDCETIDATVTVCNDAACELGLEINADGKVWISYQDEAADDLWVAEYVGVGGSGCTSDAYTCTLVDNDNTTGEYTDLALKSDGTPVISYYEDTSGGQLMLAEYVGSGGDCDTGGSGSDAYDCVTVETGSGNGSGTAIEVDINDNVLIATRQNTTTDELIVVEYVGSGGSCTATAYDCNSLEAVTNIDDRVGLVFDDSGVPWVSFHDASTSSGQLVAAKLKLPYTQLSASGNGHDAGSARMGDMRIRLTTGQSPGTNVNGTCGGVDTVEGYCAAWANDGNYDSQGVTNTEERPIYSFATKYTSNSEAPTARWVGKSDLAPSTASTGGDIVLEVYRFGSTNAWESVASDTASSDCDTDNCTLEGIASGTASEYFETEGSEYWVYFRLYQIEDGSTSYTFQVDEFRALQTGVSLRGGGVFQEHVLSPLRH